MSKTLDHEPTFIDLVLAGRALHSEIDDYISRWHDAPDDSPAAAMELHEFLGLTWEEYRLWGEQPTALRFIVRSRMHGQPLSEVLTEASELAAAARAADEHDAAKVLEWLIARGRIDPRSTE